MRRDRRDLLKVGLAGIVGGALGIGSGRASSKSIRMEDEAGPSPDLRDLYERLDRAAARPVLDLGGFTDPVVIRSMELLRNGREFLVRVRDNEGAEGLTVANGLRMVDAYPILLNRVVPFWVGRDATAYEEDLWELYRFRSNYKYQGLPYWVCVAAAEFAILDLLGKRTGRSVGELLGGRQRDEVAIYRASGNRGNTPEAEIEHLQRLASEADARALKFRVGGRMSLDADSLPGRSERLVRLARETFGSEMTLYADSNSSYSAPKAITLGHLMEECDYGFFEEPCRFDHWEETKQVADALTIPVAGGEQEYSDRRFRWAIAHHAVDVVQPDLHYYGGMVRSMRVARMAEVVGLPVAPHMSGSGLGFLDVAHFVSALPNPSPFHEYKGAPAIPAEAQGSSLAAVDGNVRVPHGPGFGVTIDSDYIKASVNVSA